MVSSSSLAACINGVADAGIDFTSAIGDIGNAINQDSVDQLKSGLNELVEGMEGVKQALENCPGMDQLVEDLGTTIAEVSSGIGDIVEVAKILINGINIYDDVSSAINDWNNGNYVAFGGDIANLILAMAKKKK